MPQFDPLARLAALERRYDGPIPATLRRAATGGGAERVAQADAAAQSALFDRLARHATAALAARRLRDGAAAPAGDLAAYRRAGLAWLARADALRRDGR